MEYENLNQILNALETDANITVAQVADALFKRWPRGVIVIAVEEQSPGCEHPEHRVLAPDWSARGGHDTILATIERVKFHMYQTCPYPPAHGPDEPPRPKG